MHIYHVCPFADVTARIRKLCTWNSTGSHCNSVSRFLGLWQKLASKHGHLHPTVSSDILLEQGMITMFKLNSCPFRYYQVTNWSIDGIHGSIFDYLILSCVICKNDLKYNITTITSRVYYRIIHIHNVVQK